LLNRPVTAHRLAAWRAGATGWQASAGMILKLSGPPTRPLARVLADGFAGPQTAIKHFPAGF